MNETFDTRTNQMLDNLLYLSERIRMFDDQIANGFRIQKSDMCYALPDVRRLTETQKKGDITLFELKQEFLTLQQRIATLEAAR